MARGMPYFAFFLMLCALSNVALPGTSGFIGEWLVLLSLFKTSWVLTLLAASTLVVGAAFTLWVYQRICYGPWLHPEKSAPLFDLTSWEVGVMALMTAPILIVGVYPAFLIQVLHSSALHLLAVSMVSHL
jgi:NADH-quinone oxidoreductase subunit M